jgi:hypothetical protein
LATFTARTAARSVRDRKTDNVRFGKLVLCETNGLYKVPTEAGWRKLYASRNNIGKARVRENSMYGLMREGRFKTCSLLYPMTGEFG